MSAVVMRMIMSVSFFGFDLRFSFMLESSLIFGPSSDRLLFCVHVSMVVRMVVVMVVMVMMMMVVIVAMMMVMIVDSMSAMSMNQNV